jgi:hypothetical protein
VRTIAQQHDELETDDREPDGQPETVDIGERIRFAPAQDCLFLL